MTIRTLTLVAVCVTTVAVAMPVKIYTVRKGDTLNKISKKLRVSQEAIREANGLKNSNHLHRGQVLTIPDGSNQVAKEPAVLGKAEITAEMVTPHAGPFFGSKDLGYLLKGSNLPALDQKPGWVKLQLPEGAGWLPSDVVKLTLLPQPFAASKETSVVENEKSIDASSNPLLNRALTYRGVRYRWGGTSRSGVDCSGFTSSVFKAEGISLPRTSLEQSHTGKAVDSSDLRPGDLVFFRTSRSYRINHVGIYVGEHKFIHAATGAGHVMVSSLDETYYKRCYAAARRVADFQTASNVAAHSQQIVQN